MKTLQLSICAFFLMISQVNFAQTVDEIIDTYIENIGGKKAWEGVKSMVAKGNGKQQGVNYPFVATMMKDGRTLIDVDLQGNSFIVEAFDGEQGWATNFQTQKAEAYDSEVSANYKSEAQDNLPSAFFNYKEKGYIATLLGKETWEGTECFKVQLEKTPVSVDGKKEKSIAIYYFDTENYVPIALEEEIKSGPGKGGKSLTIYSDYQEVDGRYLPFTEISKFNGQINLEVVYDSIEFNTKVDEAIFKMPE